MPSKSASNLNGDGKKPFVVNGDTVRKKLLFRGGDSSDAQGRGEDAVILPLEMAEKGLAMKNKGNKEKRVKPGQTPVIQKSRLSKSTIQHSQSVAKLRPQLKPIALNQISIAKPTHQGEAYCDEGVSQGAEDVFRETASFNNHHHRLPSKSSRNSGFDSIHARPDQISNSPGEFANLSIQKQKSSPPMGSSFASPSPRNIPLAHRTFAIVDPDPADPE